MAKWVCNVCGYVYEGEAAPDLLMRQHIPILLSKVTNLS